MKIDTPKNPLDRYGKGETLANFFPGTFSTRPAPLRGAGRREGTSTFERGVSQDLGLQRVCVLQVVFFF